MSCVHFEALSGGKELREGGGGKLVHFLVCLEAFSRWKEEAASVYKSCV